MAGLITERNFPTSWTIKRFKYCAQICNGGEYSDIEIEECTINCTPCQGHF